MQNSHTQTHIHSHTQTHIHGTPRSQSLTHAHSCTHAHLYTCTHTHTRSAYAHTEKPPHTLTHMHTHTHEAPMQTQRKKYRLNVTHHPPAILPRTPTHVCTLTHQKRRCKQTQHTHTNTPDISTEEPVPIRLAMGWLRLVGSFKY